MKKAIPLIFVFLLAFLGCKRGQSPLGPEELKLEGTWSEDYYLDIFYYSNNDSELQIEETETSEITFYAGKYLLRFPRHTKLYPSDPMAFEHTGSYRINDGIMTLLPDGKTGEIKFTVQYNVASITISTFNYVNPDGSVFVALSSFLWGNKYKKTTGIFLRKNSD